MIKVLKQVLNLMKKLMSCIVILVLLMDFKKIEKTSVRYKCL